MTYRKHAVAAVGLAEVVIAQNELGEWRCRLIVARVPQPNADYFTDDADDARHTAWAMARHAAQSEE
jgi:hypothetical protein